MKVAILDDWHDTLRTLPCFRLLDGHDVDVWSDHVEDVDALARRLADREALVLFRERTPVTRALVERLPQLRLVSQRSVYPHVDVAALTDHGVLLCSDMHAGTPSFAAAEHTFALILAARRQIPQQMASLKAGEWQMGVGRTLRGSRLGVWSFGRIGAAVAGYGRAFGMEVVAHGGEASCARATAAGFAVEPSRGRFFASCDVVSLHIRLHPHTRGIVRRADLAAMKPDALLVNTSRAGLIEEGALVAALRDGRPGAAAVDVFEREPVGDHPLLHMKNVVATPHIGFVTREEYDEQFADVFAQVNAFAEGRPINAINPEALGRRS